MKSIIKHLTFAIAAVLTIGTLSAFGNMQSASAVTGTFTEWDAIALGQPVRDFNPHITVLDKTGATGFAVNTPWYTIDNRSPGPPCGLGHTDPATDTLCSWGLWLWCTNRRCSRPNNWSSMGNSKWYHDWYNC